MQSQSLQTALTLGMVGLATVWWLHRVWRSWSGSTAQSPCGGCSGCSLQSPGPRPTEAAGFVPLSALQIPASPPTSLRTPNPTISG